MQVDWLNKFILDMWPFLDKVSLYIPHSPEKENKYLYAFHTLYFPGLFFN